MQFQEKKNNNMKKILPIIAFTALIAFAPKSASAETMPNEIFQTDSTKNKENQIEESQKDRNEKQTKKRKKIEDKAWIPEILAEKTFAIEIDRLFLPMGIINLRHTWLMLVRDGHVEAGLPYWGRYSAPNLSIDHPLVVEVDAPVTDYHVDTTRKGYEVNFKLYQVGETLEVELRIDKDGYVAYYRYSSMRSDIRYSGAIKMVPDKSIPFQKMSDQLW